MLDVPGVNKLFATLFYKVYQKQNVQGNGMQTKYQVRGGIVMVVSSFVGSYCCNGIYVRARGKFIA